jgi:hypothetical protein
MSAATDQMHHIHEKGTTVKPTERNAQKPSTKTGIFAPLTSPLGAQGIGTSKIGQRSGVPLRRRALVIVAALATTLGVVAFTAAPALAAAPETPVTETPNPIAATTATLKGVLNPNETGEAGTYEFVYRPSSSECRYVLSAEEATSLEAEYALYLSLGDDTKAEEKTAELNKDRAKEADNKNTTQGSSATTSPQPVSAPVSELLPGSQYTFCLIAHNSAGETATSSPVTFTTLPAAPVIIGESAVDVTASSATLNLEVNPGGADTTYRLEYGTGTSYADSVEGDAGSLSGEATIGVHVQGLEPSTVYHYRFVVSNAVRRGVEGEDQMFTTERGGSELGLLDGRQWELVTPPNKHGALIFGQNRGNEDGGGFVNPFVAKASADGEAMIDLASDPTELEPPGAANEVQVLSTHGPSGWSSEVIAPPHEQAAGPSVGSGGEYILFSEDLSHGIADPFGNGFTPLSPEATESTPYLRTDFLNGNVTEHCRASCYQPLVTRADTREGVKFGEENQEGRCEVVPGEEHAVCGARVDDATPDLSHIVLEAGTVVEGEQLTSTPNELNFFGASYYEWSGGQLQPLDLLPKSEGGAGVIANGGSSISDDGSVLFTYNGHIYLHDFAKDESYRLDVAQGVAEPSQDEANVLYAASDGSKLLFTDPQQLTTAAGGGIYECRVVEVAGSPKCELELTGLSGGSLIGGSSDASYLYFTGAGQKLIVDHYENGKWTTVEGPVVSSATLDTGLLGNGGYNPVYRISPNGRFVAFMSNEELTGYDNIDVNESPSEFEVREQGVNPEARVKHHDIEVYLYSAETNKLVCASCNPTGAQPVGTTFVRANGPLVGGTFKGLEPWTAASLPPWTTSLYGNADGGQLYQPRFLSNAGRLFFNSAEALVPQDVNGTQDVYEYEPAGVGSCSTSSVTFGERSGGCVGLISAGTSSEESAFMDASETGGDVFFITSSKLSPLDREGGLSVYDAHQCTGELPCIASPVSPPPCDTEASCKPSPTAQPTIYQAPPSATFSGPGNLTAPPPAVVKTVTKKTVTCKRGFVKKKVENKEVCVKRSKKKKNKAKKSAHTNRRAK